MTPRTPRRGAASRRRYLAAVAGLGSGALAGCASRSDGNGRAASTATTSPTERTTSTTTATQADDAVDLFFIGGQSNAVGGGPDTDGEPRPPDVSKGTAYEYEGDRGLVELSFPMGYGYSETRFGSAWPAFANAYHERTGRVAVYVQRAKGATHQLTDWHPETGDLYRRAVEGYRDAMTHLREQGYSVTRRGLLWSQGESDAKAIAQDEETPAEYRDGLQSMLAAFRSDLDAPTLPFFLFETGGAGRRLHNRFPDIGEGLRAVRRMQREVCATDPVAHDVYRGTIDYPDEGKIVAEGWHYTQAGYDEMGTAGAKRVADALAAWEGAPTAANDE
jgi:hypothetical protein